jgi:hypothetical protein
MEDRSGGRLASASSTSTANRPPAPLPKTSPKVASRPRIVVCPLTISGPPLGDQAVTRLQHGPHLAPHGS